VTSDAGERKSGRLMPVRGAGARQRAPVDARRAPGLRFAVRGQVFEIERVAAIYRVIPVR
jgi:hypothetical protein